MNKPKKNTNVDDMTPRQGRALVKRALKVVRKSAAKERDAQERADLARAKIPLKPKELRAIAQTANKQAQIESVMAPLLEKEKFTTVRIKLDFTMLFDGLHNAPPDVFGPNFVRDFIEAGLAAGTFQSKMLRYDFRQVLAGARLSASMKRIKK